MGKFVWHIRKMGYIFLDRHGDIRYCALKRSKSSFSTKISPGFLIFQVARIARIPFCRAMKRHIENADKQKQKNI